MELVAEHDAATVVPWMEEGLSDDELARLLIARMKEARRSAHPKGGGAAVDLPRAV